MDPFGISNNMMTSRPNHPFYLAVINSLQKYNTVHLSPYIRVLATTGSVFLSVVWEQYATELSQGRNRTTADGEYWEEIDLDDVLVIGKKEYERFFHSSHEASWHGSDVKAVLLVRTFQVSLLSRNRLIISWIDIEQLDTRLRLLSYRPSLFSSSCVLSSIRSGHISLLPVDA